MAVARRGPGAAQGADAAPGAGAVADAGTRAVAAAGPVAVAIRGPGAVQGAGAVPEPGAIGVKTRYTKRQFREWGLRGLTLTLSAGWEIIEAWQFKGRGRPLSCF